MTPVEQRELYDPGSDTRGDCWKCCLASILDLPYEAVPHFVQQEENGEVDNWWNATIAFLRQHRLVAARFGLWGDETPYLQFGSQEIEYHFSAPGHWIASVRSPRFDGLHAVVMRGSKVAFDPHPQREQGHRGFREAVLLTHI